MVRVSVVVPAYNVGHVIDKMLSSLNNQTFKDFEVLIINDGSTDDTGKIAESYCKKNRRFQLHTQENRGVSAARNAGMNLAKGEYIVFYDADDFVPKTALENMVIYAEMNDADLVIGRFKISRIYGSKIIKSSIRLSKKGEISKFDSDLLWNFSVCNKMFRRELLERQHQRFDITQRITEDGLFCLSFISQCNKICGCPFVVYEYCKRPFWEEASVTQSASKELLDNTFRAFLQLEEIVTEFIDVEKITLSTINSEKKQDICKKLFFQSTLYKRFVKSDLLANYYKNLWSGYEDFYVVINEYLSYCRKKMFPDMWKQLVEQSLDLKIDEGIKSRTEVAAEPTVTIILTEDITSSGVNSVLHSCYHQEFPFFEILIAEQHVSYVDEIYRKKENFHIITSKKPLAQQVRGKYTMLLADDVCFVGNTLREMLKHLDENEVAGCVIAPIMEMKDKKVRSARKQLNNHVPPSNMLFKSGFLAYDNLDQMDWSPGTVTDTFMLKTPIL